MIKKKTTSTEASQSKATNKRAAKAKSKAIAQIPAKSNKTTTKSKATTKIKAKSKIKVVPKVKLVSRQTADEMLEILCKQYPDADCELTFENDYQLLTSVILSAQTTDVQVNKVTPILFKHFPTAKTLAEAPLYDIKKLIRPTGYFNAKANNIQHCAQVLVSKFNGNVPTTLDELITLPGVGRKTANVVLGVAHNIPGWTVDTHVNRLSRRLGLTQNSDPAKIEIDLQKLFPQRDWTKYSITLIWHGRRLCFARNPDCASCPINHLCPSSLV